MDKIIERNWNNDPLSYPVVFGHKKKKNNVEPLNPHLEVSVHLFMDDARHFGKDWAVAHFFRMEEHFKEIGRKDPEPDCVVEWVRKVENGEYDFDSAVYSVPPVDEPLILTQRFDVNYPHLKLGACTRTRPKEVKFRYRSVDKDSYIVSPQGIRFTFNIIVNFLGFTQGKVSPRNRVPIRQRTVI